MGMSTLIRRMRISSMSVGIITMVIMLAYSIAMSTLIPPTLTPTMARAIHIKLQPKLGYRGNLHGRATWQNTTGSLPVLVLLITQAKEDAVSQ